MHAHREQQVHSRFLGLKPRSTVKDLRATDLLEMIRSAMASRGLDDEGQEPPSTPHSPSPFSFDYGGGFTPGVTNYGTPGASTLMPAGAPIPPPATIGRERLPTRLQRDKILAKAIDRYRNRLDVDPAMMRCRLPGRDGSIEDAFTVDSFSPQLTPEQRAAAMAFLKVITSNHAKFHNTQAQTSDLLQNLIRLDAFNVFAPGITCDGRADAAVEELQG
jgi:hypothetical protein